MENQPERVKIEIEIPKGAQDFGTEYAKLVGIDFKELTKRIVIGKLREIHDRYEALPYLQRKQKTSW
jgi:hypothetical protein